MKFAYVRTLLPSMSAVALLLQTGCTSFPAADLQNQIGSISSIAGMPSLGSSSPSISPQMRSINSRQFDGYARLVTTAVVSARLAGMLSQQDQKQVASSSAAALETNKKQSWSNPKTGVKGSSKVVKTQRKTETVPAAPRPAAKPAQASLASGSPPAPAAQSAPVKVEREYKTISQEIVMPDGKVHTEQVTLVKDANGKWVKAS